MDELDDQPTVSEWLCDAFFDHAVSDAEISFSRALEFHFDFLNGGLDQAISNKRDDLADFIGAFRTVDLGLIAAIIEAAGRISRDGGSESEAFRMFDDAYLGLTYDLHFLQRQRGVRSDVQTPDADQIQRALLRFARQNRPSFGAVLSAASRKP